jgi:peroxiredoxin
VAAIAAPRAARCWLMMSNAGSGGSAEAWDGEPAERVSARPRYASPTVLLVGAVASVLLIVVGVLSLLDSSPAATSSLVGMKLSAFSEPSVSGPHRVRAPWLAHHPSVLLFFGDWCTICHGEVRTLGPALGDGALGRVRVVGIDSDASVSVARTFLAASDVRFPVAHDWLPVVTEQYVPADPATFFVAATGRVVAVHYGAISLAQLDAGLAQLGGA